LRSDDGVDETWVLVRREEANTLDGTISTESPVGQALLGRRLGESAIVKTPSGPITYHIISVQ
jgi:transcription elongation factor GreA